AAVHLFPPSIRTALGNGVGLRARSRTPRIAPSENPTKIGRASLARPENRRSRALRPAAISFSSAGAPPYVQRSSLRDTSERRTPRGHRVKTPSSAAPQTSHCHSGRSKLPWVATTTGRASVVPNGTDTTAGSWSGTGRSTSGSPASGGSPGAAAGGAGACARAAAAALAGGTASGAVRGAAARCSGRARSARPAPEAAIAITQATPTPRDSPLKTCITRHQPIPLRPDRPHHAAIEHVSEVARIEELGLTTSALSEEHLTPREHDTARLAADEQHAPAPALREEPR